MSAKETKICRLCLKKLENSFEVITEMTEEIFEVLQVKVDLNVSEEPIICSDCLKCAKKCFLFKSECLLTERIVLYSTIVNKHAQPMDIRFIHHDNNTFDEDSNVCRFCMKCLKSNAFISLDHLMQDVLLEGNMLPEYFLEMDFEIIREPVVCPSCLDSLMNYLNFLRKTRDVEETINRYCEMIKSDGCIDLNDVVCIKSEDVSECDAVSDIQVKPIDLENTENHQDPNLTEDPFADMTLHESLEFHFSFDKNYDDIEEQVENPHKAKYLGEDNQMDLGDDMKIQNSLECDTKLSQMCPVKEDTLSENSNINKIQNSLGCDTKLSQMCPVKEEDTLFENSEINNVTTDTKDEDSDIKEQIDVGEGHPNRIFKLETMLNNPSEEDLQGISVKLEPGILKDDMTDNSFQLTANGANLNSQPVRAKPSREDICRCQICHVILKIKSLKGHMLLHSDPAGIPIYKCNVCPFNTKYRQSFEGHMLRHAPAIGLKMYKCEKCDYTTRHKHNIKPHMVVHTNRSNTKTYPCDICYYKTKNKQHWRVHMLQHAT